MRLTLDRCLLAVLIPLVAFGCAPDQTGSETSSGSAVGETTISDDSLVDELRDGGEVIYLRHSATDVLETDEDMSDLQDCSAQRNLTREGREQARRIGEAFVRLDIPVGEVLSSPYCRTRQTAELAFGRGEVRTTRDLLSPEYVPISDAPDVADYEDNLTRLLAAYQEPEENRVLVGHESILMEVTGESVAEGGAVIFQPLGERNYRVLGRVGPEEWPGL